MDSYSEYGLTPEQYHAGVAKLWEALGVSGLQQEDVFTLAAKEIMRLKSKVKERPWIDRVLEEKRELDARATKLSEFIGLSDAFTKLLPDEQERMKEQCEIMWQYSEILGKRILAQA